LTNIFTHASYTFHRRSIVAIMDVIATVIGFERTLVKILAKLDGHLFADKVATFGSRFDVFFGRGNIVFVDTLKIRVTINATINRGQKLAFDIQQRNLDIIHDFHFGQDSIEIFFFNGFLDDGGFLGGVLAVTVLSSRFVRNWFATGSEHILNLVVHTTIKHIRFGSGTKHIWLLAVVDQCSCGKVPWPCSSYHIH
jgi:hypothetical protein